MSYGGIARHCLFLLLLVCLYNSHHVTASIGDRLPEFRSCVAECVETNCGPDGLHIPLQHRLLFWDCPSECDYACQHITTSQRLARDPPFLNPIVQYHGKWPFYRLLGMQEPASVLFSLFNYLAHDRGMNKVRDQIPASYPLRKYYLLFGYFGLATWIFSMIFHTRDFNVTEKLDYFAAGASVMYGLFFAAIRVFRLDMPRPSSTSTNNSASAILRAWTFLCASLYLLHIWYLTFIRFDYTYNMAANVVIGIMQNLLWTYFSVQRFRKVGRLWAAWPGLIVAWIMLAMSMELLDFAPVGGMVDAHALWHLGTVAPTVMWYNFLVKDAQEDLHSARLKA